MGVSINLEDFRKRLKKYTSKDVVFSSHAREKLFLVEVKQEDVIKNLLNPEKLVFVELQENNRFNCYFAYSKQFYHRYVTILSKKIIVVTVISIRRKWQDEVKKFGKKLRL